MNKKTICLNMIVRNESQVIRRCLVSIKQLIDYWVIVDTGSNDGTQAIILDFLSDIPGELHERSWVSFAFNRNEALALAKNKGDYLLFIDADDWLEMPSSFVWPELNKDRYFVAWRIMGEIDRHTLLINHDYLGNGKAQSTREWFVRKIFQAE